MCPLCRLLWETEPLRSGGRLPETACVISCLHGHYLKRSFQCLKEYVTLGHYSLPGFNSLKKLEKRTKFFYLDLFVCFLWTFQLFIKSFGIFASVFVTDFEGRVIERRCWETPDPSSWACGVRLTPDVVAISKAA